MGLQAAVHLILNAEQTMENPDERRGGQEDASRLRRAADALDDTRARLQRTSAELRERERELNRTSNLVRDVERRTAALRSATSRRKKDDRK